MKATRDRHSGRNVKNNDPSARPRDHPAKLAFDAVIFDGSAPAEALALTLVTKLPDLLRRRLLSSYCALTMKGW